MKAKLLKKIRRKSGKIFEYYDPCKGQIRYAFEDDCRYRYAGMSFDEALLNLHHHMKNNLKAYVLKHKRKQILP